MLSSTTIQCYIMHAIEGAQILCSQGRRPRRLSCSMAAHGQTCALLKQESMRVQVWRDLTASGRCVATQSSSAGPSNISPVIPTCVPYDLEFYCLLRSLRNVVLLWLVAHGACLGCVTVMHAASLVSFTASFFDTYFTTGLDTSACGQEGCTGGWACHAMPYHSHGTARSEIRLRVVIPTHH